jgi:hypothetical protein
MGYVRSGQDAELRRLVGGLLVLALAHPVAPEGVDGAAFGDGHQPGAPIGRDAGLRPFGEGDDHPTAEWTLQQFRMIVADDQPHRFVIHDRDTIYSDGRSLTAMGLTVLKTPVRTPTANAFCERLVGTMRRVLRLHDPAERKTVAQRSS